MGGNGLQHPREGHAAPAVDDITPRIAQWREQLLDLTKRNRLINCRIGPAGALELAHPKLDSVWQLTVIKSGAMSFPRKAELLGMDPEDEDAEETPGEEAAAPRQSEEDRLRACIESES